MNKLKTWWNRYKANQPYTRRQLNNIHKVAMSDAYMGDDGLEYTEVRTDVLDKILCGCLGLHIDVWLWIIMAGLMAFLILWRG